MRIKLLEYTRNAEHVVAMAAHQCYNPNSVIAIHVRDSAKNEALIKKVIGLGHTSVLEHASYTFAISGISRACSHQLVRHRVASFSQQSQRYCFLGEDFEYGTPPTIEDSVVKFEYDKLMKQIGNFYNYMVEKGIPAEDARYILPNAADTHLVMTMNARELHHFFSLRCCTCAQWEIRDMAKEMLSIVRHIHPVLFENAGPNCVRGYCTEGTKSCYPELVR